MIEIVKPYEINAFNNAFKVVALLKNCAIQICKSNSFATKSPVFISVRWCKDRNMFVGDNGTSLNRDKSGITIDQIDKHANRLSEEIINIYKKLLTFCNNSTCFYDFCHMHKLTMNKFKCIVFNVDIENNMLLPIGVFCFVKSKHREGIDSIKNNKITAINISHAINKKISSFNPDMFEVGHLIDMSKKINIDVYYNEITNKEKNSNFIYRNFSFKKEKFKDDYYKLKNSREEKYKSYFFIQDIINSIFNNDLVNLDIIIVYDSNLQKFIKLKKINYNHTEDEQLDYKNYLPIIL